MLHHAAVVAVPVLFTIGTALGTIQKWTQACWPLMLAGSVIWLAAETFPG